MSKKDVSFCCILKSYLPTLPVFPGVSKFFIQSPSLPVRAPNLPGNTFRGFFQFFFSLISGKIKQEVHLFELFSIEKRKNKAMESAYITDGYWYWSEINQSNCTTHGRKLARFSHAAYRWSAWLSVHCKNNYNRRPSLGF